MLRVGPQDAPGILEMWSPDLFVQWAVEQTEDGFFNRQLFRTGPASRSAIYVPRGGEVSAVVQTSTGAHVNEYNGYLTRERPEPSLRCRFVPKESGRPYIDPQRFVHCSLGAGSDRPPLLPGVITDVAYPPHYAKTVAVSAQASVNVQVSNIAGSITQLRGVNPTPGAFPFPVDPWSIVQIQAGQQATDATLLWGETLEVYV